jgi:hypothetical protein
MPEARALWDIVSFILKKDDEMGKATGGRGEGEKIV